MLSAELEAWRRLSRRRRTLLRMVENDTEEPKEDLPGDWVDSAVREETNQIIRSLSEHERSELTAIDAALVRLKKGAYGICAGCGDPIGGERLRIVPEATLCVGCQAITSRH